MIEFESKTAMPRLIEEERERVKEWIRRVAATYGYRTGDIHYIFCTDEQLLTVNQQFLHHDYYTDVITFDYSTSVRLSGDIFISLEMVSNNARELGCSEDDELRRILIHGILHLTGQGDKTPETKAEMTRKENEALAMY